MVKYPHKSSKKLPNLPRKNYDPPRSSGRRLEPFKINHPGLAKYCPGTLSLVRVVEHYHTALVNARLILAVAHNTLLNFRSFKIELNNVGGRQGAWERAVYIYTEQKRMMN